MVSAFILITCDVGKEDIVMNQLQRLSDIKDVTMVHGAYDFIAKVDGKSIEQVKEVLSYKIRSINAVRSAMSLPLKFYN